VKFGQHLEQLVSMVSLGEDQLTPTSLQTVLDHVNQRLKECGHPLLNRKKLVSHLEDDRKHRARRRKVRADAQAAAELGQDGGEFVPQPRYAALSQISYPGDLEGATRYGLIDREDNFKHLTDFELVIDEERAVQDDVEGSTAFVGRLLLPDREEPVRIPAANYASDERLRQALYSAGGSGLTIDCTMGVLRNAVAATSPNRVRRRFTTNFGWCDDGKEFLVPQGRVTATGFIPSNPDDPLRLDLTDCPQASHLGLRPLPDDELWAVKRHVVEDLLALHRREVTYPLFGMAAAAILRPFSGVSHRFAGWLVGETGSGKTLLAKLVMGFFGDYRPGDDNRFASWCWTPNAIEKAGYYFKDSLYLVDDFKAGTTWHAQNVRLLQAYGDGTARARLKSDANFNPARPIRGLLLATGENTVDQEASAMARTVLVRVEPPQKDLERRQRCLDRCGSYSGVMAGFITWLLAQGRTKEFADRVRMYEGRYYRQVSGQPNDARVAANLAVLASAFAEFAEFLGDVWPAWQEEVRRFGEEDVPALLSQMMGAVREQRAIEVFWNILSHLIRCSRVRLDTSDSPSTAPIVGKWLPGPKKVGWVVPELALAEVQKTLRDQGRPLLALTAGEIPGLLRKEGRLVDRDGKMLQPRSDDSGIQQLRYGGERQRGFRINVRELHCAMPADDGADEELGVDHPASE
jgi:hypothetical protein